MRKFTLVLCVLCVALLPCGGALANTVNITSVSIENQSNPGDGGGAAVMFPAPGPHTLTITASTIANNHAGGNGGSLYLSASGSLTTTISDTSFTGNSAGGDGGALYLVNTDPASQNTFAISNATFTNNSAGGDGSVLYIAGGTNTVTLTDCSFTGNTGNYALYIEGNVTLNNCTFGPNDLVYATGTIAAPAPVLRAMTPAAGSTGVDVATNALSLTFDSPVFAAAGGVVQLQGGGQTHSLPVSSATRSADGKTMQLTLPAALQPGTPTASPSLPGPSTMACGRACP